MSHSEFLSASRCATLIFESGELISVIILQSDLKLGLLIGVPLDLKLGVSLCTEEIMVNSKSSELK